MISLQEFNVVKTEEKGNVATYEVSPLPTGYGHTLANVFKRVLQSSIPGAAITGVKIDGVEHEYATLEGVKDDMLAVILSLKNVIFFSKSEEAVRLSIDVKGAKGKTVEVKASDIEKNSDVEVINEDYVITKLTSEKAKFKAEIIVERGIGYTLPKEEVREEIGMLPVDAIFSPVVNVNYNVVPTRVGGQTELDKVVMNIETNGSITPSDAFSIAANILSEMTSNLVSKTADMISGKVDTAQPLPAIEEVEVVGTGEVEESIMINDLNLSTRLHNALSRAGFSDLRKLEGFSEEELGNIRGMGEKSLEELLDVLKKNEIKII